jgi:hypothetical protein
MKTLKLIGLGIGIWSLSLLWPTVNQYLTPAVTTVSITGLAVIYLLHTLITDHSASGGPVHPQSQPHRPVEQPSITRPTKPIRLT